MTLARILVLALATYRLARIATADTISAPWREALYRFAWNDDVLAAEPAPRAPWRTWAYELLTCPLCLGVWLAAAVWAGWEYGPAAVHGLIVVLAIAGAQALAAQRDPS